MELTPDVTAAQISALLTATNDAYSWQRPYASNRIEVSFMQSMPAYSESLGISPDSFVKGADGKPAFLAFTFAEQKIIKDAFAAIAKVIDVTFVFTDTPGAGAIRLGKADVLKPGQLVGGANFRVGGNHEQPLVNDIYLPLKTIAAELDFGSEGFRTVLHEIGHALGFRSDHISEEYSTQRISESASVSIMSYAEWMIGHSMPQGRAKAMTPLVLDILALQTLWGPPSGPSAHTEPTTYVFDPRGHLAKSQPEDTVFYATQVRALWDGDGIDTLNASAYSDSVSIDLRPGYLSSIGGSKNIGIAFGTLIENATGGQGADIIIGNSAANILNGGNGDGKSDYLSGREGVDTYIFKGNFGRDELFDSDGRGRIEINEVLLNGQGNGSGKSGEYQWQLRQGTKVYTLTLRPTDDDSSHLVISQIGDKSNTITINGFDLDAARGANGYLGIKLDAPRVVIQKNAGISPFSKYDFDVAAANGSSTFLEGNSSFYTIYLDQPAKAGAILTLALSGNTAMFTATLGDSTVPVNGAVITLVEGQTQASFMLHQVGDLSASISSQLSVSYTDENFIVTSNNWVINVTDAGDSSLTFNGDQRALLRGIETEQGVIAPGDSRYNTYKWSAATWSTNGTLLGGMAEVNFNDVIYASAGKDKVAGLGGNDALDGLAGDDQIDGGSGDDLIGGGAGSDVIHGGAGNDFIFGATGLAVYERIGPTDQWTPPSGEAVVIQGSNWGVFKTPDGKYNVAGGGSISMDIAGDVIYAEAGNDGAVGGLGADYIDGGEGDDRLTGHGGEDVLIGGSGADYLNGDGLKEQGFYETLAETQHGSDFLDGGEGDDTLLGGGADDVLYGGIGSDRLWGDDQTESKLSGESHGNDFLDGEDGQDQLVGGGGDDILYGGAGEDALWGDADSEDVLSGTFHGMDYLDGEDGNDQLVGGGKDDTLYGGAGADYLLGDDIEPNLAGQYHGADWIDGGDGNDNLVGGGGDDTLLGGYGDDVLDGDQAAQIGLSVQFHGNDYLDGGDGNDGLFGNGGDDTLVGGAGADYMAGGAGNDHYIIDETDVTRGGTQTETIEDAEGDNIVEFGSSITAVGGGSGADVVVAIGDPSEQRFVLLRGAFAGGIGKISVAGEQYSLKNWLQSNVTSAVNINAASGQSVFGAAGSDRLVANGEAVQLEGGRGNDVIELNSGKGSTVAMAVGDGMDIVYSVRREVPIDPAEIAPRNILQLTDGFSADQLRIYKVSSQSFVLSLNEQGDAITFTTATNPDGTIAPGNQPFDAVKLGDGSLIEWQQLVDRGIVNVPVATEENDVLVLTPISDIVSGLGGNDRIEGVAGDDQMYGGYGDDTLIGGLGNDTLDGGQGTNLLIGGDGDDYFISGSDNANDSFEGGQGNDTYRFRFGYLLNVTGRAYDESSTSNDTYRVVDSGTVGGDGFQTWYIKDFGGENDRLLFDSSLVTTANTTVRSTGTGFALTSWNITVNIENALDSAGNLKADGIESVGFRSGATWTMAQLRSLSLQSTSDNDRILGFGSDDSIDGGAGNDTLSGGGGNDSLSGGAGFDQLNGGEGDDTLTAGLNGGRLIGGAGADRYVLKRGDGTVDLGTAEFNKSESSGIDTLAVDANPGEVTISYQAAVPDPYNYYNYDFLNVSFNDGSASARFQLVGPMAGSSEVVERIVFADGSVVDVSAFVATRIPLSTGQSDTSYLSSLGDLFNAGAGYDAVYGRFGNDTLYGAGGDDTLSGGDDDDYLDGGLGDDLLDLGQGNDTVVFGAGYGNDFVFGGENATAIITPGTLATDFRVRWGSAGLELKLVNSDEKLGIYVYQSIAAPSILSSDHSAVGTVIFGDGTRWDKNTLYAMANVATAGNDTLRDYGGVGSLSGGEGSDFLYAVNSAAVLNGGSGNDMLTGGNGADRFIGGVGNDTVNLSAGGDTVAYALGDGNDVLDRFGSVLVDRFAIEFGAGIETADITFKHQSDTSFDILVSGGGGIHYDPNAYPDFLQLGEFRFSDSTVWTAQDVIARLFQGTAADDVILGFGTADSIFGGDGNDVIRGLRGNDILSGGNGNDTLYGSENTFYSDGDFNAMDVLVGGGGDDLLYAETGAVKYLFGVGFGHDTIRSTQAAALREEKFSAIAQFGGGILPSQVVVIRGTGSELNIWVKSTGDTIRVESFFATGDSNAPPNTARPLTQINFDDGSVWSTADIVARLSSSASPFSDSLYGTEGADNIDALGGNDFISGGAGNDTLVGGEGYDQIDGGDGDDILIGGAGNDEIISGMGFDRFQYSLGDGQDVIFVMGAGELIFGNGIFSGDVKLNKNQGNLFVNVGVNGDQVIVYSFFDGYDKLDVRFQDGTVWDAQWLHDQASAIRGTSGNDLLTGLDNSADQIYGLAGNDRLVGLSGNDMLDGGSGSDTLEGGTGDDTYLVDDISDVVTETSNAGYDRIVSSVTYVVAANVEAIELTGTANINATGNGLANYLTGNAGNNVLNGGAGADTLSGGAGDDTYVVDTASDVVNELTGEGIDLVQSSVNYILAVNVEDLTLTGSSSIAGTGNALNNVLTGNGVANTLIGGGGDDTLNGGGGNDVMSGGAGNDIYVVDAAGDVVTENANEGTDTVQSGVTYSLAANVENLTLLGTSVLNATGNSAANVLVGNSGNNTLDGGAGADQMAGGGGDDTYVVDNTGDVVVEVSGAGNDLVQSSVTYTLATEVERLTLTGTANSNGTGNTLSNTLIGNAGANRLDGGSGADTMTGGAGNDVYVVDNVSDSIVEVASGGTDAVEAAVSWTLAAEVENLTLMGTSALNATGNSVANVLTGNAGDNVLNGGAGNDTMVGGAGNDTYVVDATGDVITEQASAGTDLVQSSVTYTLGANVENLTLSGTTAINGVGNTLNNVLVGNSAANSLTGGAGDDNLDGGAGNDSLIGGAGNDTYVVDSSSDVVTENASEGTDTVRAALTYTLGSNVENLVLTGTGSLNGTGNAVANVLTGNSGNNVLSGGAGNDSMSGGLGNDTYVVDAVGDIVIELAAEGTDLVQSSVTYTLAANIENLTLTGTAAINATGNSDANSLVGNSGNNLLTGYAGDDVLDGLAGTDTMVGGLGNDTYFADSASDVITELANEGIDTLAATFTTTLTANLENLRINGTGALNGTGNASDNILFAGAGNNVMDGLGGLDTVSYLYATAAVSVTLASTTAQATSGSGSDTLLNIENLTGSGFNDTLTGSTAANVLQGGAGNDTISSGSGNDTLDGGAGVDALTGGVGNDTYLLGRGYGSDSVTENDSTSGNLDVALFGSDVAKDQLWFRQVGNNLEVSIIGTGDQFTMNSWYLGNQYHVERFRTSDGRVLTDTNVQNLVQAMASFSPPAAGQTTLPANYATALSPALAANWQ